MDRHKIEQGVKVYLVHDGEEWSVDPVTLDGSPLDETMDAAKCAAGHEIERDVDECGTRVTTATFAYAPTGQELTRLLAKEMTLEEICDLTSDLIKIIKRWTNG